MGRLVLNKSAVVLAGLAGLVLLFYRQAAFTNLIFARGDTLLYFYPYWDYRDRALLAGHLPLWNPYLFMGAPFLANSQAGVFYPLNWPLAIFSAPVAVKISLIVHSLLAAWGTYALARRAFKLDPYPAALAASVFALGGYLTAQVEHVNQLQGLAWLPLALLLTLQLSPGRPAGEEPSGKKYALLYVVALAAVIALQLTAGHTQTTFITLVACLLVAIYNLGLMPWMPNDRRFNWSALGGPVRGLGIFGLGLALAFAIAAIQLLPTLELSRLSLRGGGLPLNEAVSFSLNPLLIGKALLPGYGRILFSEFVAYTGLGPLGLAVLALGRLRQDRMVLLAALLAALGLFFAFGGYNPVYLALARFVPGFNFFRVPARWLALWALGAAILAGAGLQALTRPRPPIELRQLALLGLGPVLLAGLAFAAASITPPGESGPLGNPGPVDLGLWLAALMGFLVLLGLHPYFPNAARIGLGVITLVELLVAAQGLPLNHLTAPDAYASIRPAMTQLLAAQADRDPPGRFLSLSALEFDPGDLAELHSEWDNQLAPDAVYDAIVATKHKEVLSPNLPLTWGLPAVDGYDGGILPLRAYADFARQFGELPADTDGRLRQFLKTIPPNWLLSLTDTRWIITDKTGDAWIDEVFYDLGQTISVTSAAPLTFNHIPALEATHLGLVLGTPGQSGAVQITLENGRTITRAITPDQISISNGAPFLRLGWGSPALVRQIVVFSPAGLTLSGASLIDERTGSFQSLTLGPYRLAHSGDVKIYENLDVLPRAFLVQDPGALTGRPAALPSIQNADTRIVKYEAEQVVIQITSDKPGYLVLTDTDYPGWQATVDGGPVQIQPAWGLFRSVAIPAGEHTVEFRFDPLSLKLGALVSGAALLAWLGLLFFGLRQK